MEETWINKLTLKKWCGNYEADLIEIVSQGHLTPHALIEGKYYPLPLYKDVPFESIEPNPSQWMASVRPYVRQIRHHQVKKTKEEIAEE